MTSQNFDARYQLLKCVAVADGIRTHNAIELVTGRVVMVHLVDAAGPDEVEALQRRLGRLPQTEKARVLEIATLPAGFAVVTEFLQGMGNFPEWLAARVPDDSVELPSQVPAGASLWPIQRPTDPVTPFAAEFTSGETTQDGAGLALFPPAKEVSTHEVPRQTATAESLPSRPAAVTSPQVTPPVTPPTPPPVTTPQITPVVAPPAPPPPEAPAGDFTRMFGAPTKPATPVPAISTLVPPTLVSPPPPPFVPPVVLQTPPPVAPSVAPPLPAAPHPAPLLGEGEFTRMFRGPAPAPKPKDEVRSPLGASPPPTAPVVPPIAAAPLAPPPLAPPPLAPPPLTPPRPPAAKPAVSLDELFGTLPPASSLPPVAMPYAPPIPSRENAPPASPFGSPPNAGAGARPGGLSASPLGNPSANVPPLNLPPFGRSQLTPPPLSNAPAASTPVPSTLGSPIPGSPLGLPSLPSLPPLPPPAENAPMFPGGGAGNAVSPLGAGRATPASRGGVYTEMIQRSVTPPPVVAIVKKPTADAPARKKNIPLGLIIALNAVLILAVILIAYFVFKPKKAPDAGDGTTPSETVPADSATKKSGTMPKMPKLPDAPTAPTVPTVTKPTIPTLPKLK